MITSASGSWFTALLDHSRILESSNIRSVSILNSLSLNVTAP